MTDKPKPHDSSPRPNKPDDPNYDTDVPEQRTVDSLEKTVAFSNVDQTVQFTPSEVVKAVSGSVDRGKKTLPASANDRTIELADLIDAGSQSEVVSDPVSVATPPRLSSVLNDTNISQTVNPRELSAEDAAFWGELSRASSAGTQPSRMSPAINRSLSETKLHLRDQLVADARSDLASQSDYRLLQLLGKGGMGNVHLALQRSLDRQVALKVIKPMEEEKKKRFKQKGTLEQVEQERRLQFISEAVVTGDLDHPNIVPIHDVAVTGDNLLFYSMKRVSGTPWSKVINDRTRDENIDILLKVCDAIGFAHTRGVIHRDIKPENIMIGEFGEVMVMDWGLALAKPEFKKLDSVHHSTGLGGSPAYMAPEMAVGPVERIGPASDIYLLGATLFQIITSFAPHQASNISECLKVVAANKIREVPQEQQGELLQVALKAMATGIEDRYASVKAFQEAIRDYRSHSESIRLAMDAQIDLEGALETTAYEDFSRAIFGFEEAIKLWPGNSKAVAGLAAARLQYAETAFQKGDFDLGLSLLDRSSAKHASLIERLENGKQERLARVRKLTLFRYFAAAMLAIIIVGGGAAMIAIQRRSNEALEARTQAENNLIEVTKQKALVEVEKEEAKLARDKAKAAEASALVDRDKAITAEHEQKLATDEATKAQEAERIAKVDALARKAEADLAKTDAEAKKREAEDAKAIAEKARLAAEYEKYVSNIGLAKAHIDQNEFGQAQQILTELKIANADHARTWEWRWLWRQTTQARSTQVVTSPARVLEFAGSGGTFASVLDNGAIQFVNVGSDGALSAVGKPRPLKHSDTSAIALSPDRRSIAVASRSGDIAIWDAALSNLTNSWTAHKTTINRLRFIDNNTLVSASDDNSIKVWDAAKHMELAACWNLGPIKDLDIAPVGDSWIMVAAVAESTSGRATVWKLDPEATKWKSKLVGEFLEHQRPVLCVSLSPDGKQAISGDIDGQVFVWDLAAAQATNYESKVENAIRSLSTNGTGNNSKKPAADAAEQARFKRLVDPDLIENGDSELAHSDRVRVVRFSPDGKTILSGGDDYLIRLWDTTSGKRTQSLRGHGGWVLDANFIGEGGTLIVSSSADATIRSWHPQNYTTAAISTSAAQSLHSEEILSARLNVSGSAVVTASRDRIAKVSRINPVNMTLQTIAELRVDDDAVALKEGTQFVGQSMAVDLEHSLLYVASADSTVRAWDLIRGTERFQLPKTGLNTTIALSRDGRYLLTRSSDADAKCLLWRIDPIAKKLALPMPVKFAGHARELAVTALAISNDGSRLFTADNAGIGIFWDGKSGKQIGEKFELLRGYRINAAEFSANGQELFVAADDQQLTRIDLTTRKVISRWNHTGFVTSLSLTPDDRFAVTIDEQTTVKETRLTATLWNLATGTSQVVERATSTLKPDKQSAGKRQRIATAQFGPDGSTFAIGKQTASDNAGRVVIWSLANAEKAVPVRAFELPPALGTPQACVPLPNDRMLTLNGDAAFQWTLQSKAAADAEKSVASHLISYRANSAVHSANFSADERFVITGSQSVKIWDLTSQNRAVAKVETPHAGLLTCVEFSPLAGSYQFATCGADGTVKLFDFDPTKSDTKLLRTWLSDESLPPLRRVCFSDDGSMLLAVGDQGIVRLISLNGENVVTKYDTSEAGNLTAASFSSDGKLIVVGGDDKQARLWRVVAANEPIAVPIEFVGHAEPIEDIKVLSSSAGPLRVLTASRDKSVRLWDPRIGSDDPKGRELLNLREHTQGVTAVDASESGDLVITAGRDADLILWPASHQTIK